MPPASYAALSPDRYFAMAKQKSSSKVHTANLFGNEAHGLQDKTPDRGCVFRCSRKGHKHRENGYAYTKANYHTSYNIAFHREGPDRDRFDAVFGSRVFRNQRGWDPRYTEGTWYIGGKKPNNYLKGLHPFSNQAHHILPVGAFHDSFDHEELILLMLAGYNINCGENIIILPTATDIGQVMEMLTHPGSHPQYSMEVKKKVNQIKAKLSKGRDPEEEGHHPVEEDEIGNLKKELVQWSIDQWGELYIYGKSGFAGTSVNEAAKSGLGFASS